MMIATTTPAIRIPFGNEPCQPHSADGSSCGSTPPRRAVLRDVLATAPPASRTSAPPPEAARCAGSLAQGPLGGTSSHSTGTMAAMTTTTTTTPGTPPGTTPG